MDMLDKGMIHALWKSKQPSMELYHVIQQKHNLKLKLVISGIPISYFFSNYGGFHEMEIVEDSQSSLKVSLP